MLPSTHQAGTQWTNESESCPIRIQLKRCFLYEDCLCPWSETFSDLFLLWAPKESCHETCFMGLTKSQALSVVENCISHWCLLLCILSHHARSSNAVADTPPNKRWGFWGLWSFLWIRIGDCPKGPNGAWLKGSLCLRRPGQGKERIPPLLPPPCDAYPELRADFVRKCRTLLHQWPVASTGQQMFLRFKHIICIVNGK